MESQDVSAERLKTTFDEFRSDLFAEREFFPFYWVLRLLRESARFLLHRMRVKRLVSFGRPCV